MVQLTNEPINAASVLELAISPKCGAVVLFLGTVREVTKGRGTDSLDYECYPEMAKKKMTELEEQAQQRWPIEQCVLVHRLGHLAPAEISVAIAVSTPHRADAFAAGQWLIDTFKEVVPIWKRENWSDGSTEWVHPGMPKLDNDSGIVP